MRILPEENFESWAKRATEYEKARAERMIRRGRPQEEVLAEYSRRLSEKLMHPLIKIVNDTATPDLERLEESKRRYEQEYIQRYGRKADHVGFDD